MKRLLVPLIVAAALCLVVYQLYSSGEDAKQALAKHQDIELLLQLGEYKRGTDPDADFAIERIGPIRQLLQQSSGELVPFAQSSETLRKLFA